jgi:hypothetical protein
MSTRAWRLGALVLVPIGVNIAAIKFGYGIPANCISACTHSLLGRW